MKNILISCVSLFLKTQTVDKDDKPRQPIVYSSDDSSEDITVSALQTNEACVKFLMKKLARSNKVLDAYILVQSKKVQLNKHTMLYLDSCISELRNEGLAAPEKHECFLGEDEKEHRYDRVLNEISEKIRNIAGNDPEVSIYLDMAGGKRDNYVFIQLLTKLLSFYGFDVHTYYADITDEPGKGTIVNTDLSFRHMKILDAVNEFIRFGSVTSLRECFAQSESIVVRTLLKAMEDFSNSLQLCATDLADVVLLLNQQIDQIEKYVSYDKDDLFVIGTILPLIRKKFDIELTDSRRGTLNIIKWCLEHNMTQQALTIYNEKAYDLIIDKEMIVIDEKMHGADIKQMQKDKHIHASQINKTKLRFFMGKVFSKMYKDPSSGTPEMEKEVGKYKGKHKTVKYYKNGDIECHNLEWTMSAVFFAKNLIPDGVTVNIDDELLGKILSDVCFATCARNSVNHASDTDTYDKALINLFKNHPFSSYRDTFAPQNVKQDLLCAVENLEKALDLIDNAVLAV